MATITVSSLLNSDGHSLLLSRSSLTKLRASSQHHGAHFRRSKREKLIRVALPTSVKKNVGGEDEFHEECQADFCKGWTDGNGMPAQRLVSQFDGLSVAISDRVEMHSILAQQRDNWNRLLHNTITFTSVSAAVASSLNGAATAQGLQLVAIILGTGAAALMTLVSKFQPSQLAEEQRHAARFFKRLGAEVEATLDVDPRLREEASAYWEQSVGTLHALDRAFPLPLTPIVVEKFPKHVCPSQLSGELGLSRPEVEESSQSPSNGWTSSVVEDLKHTANLLHDSDVPEYVNLANNAKIINLILSIVSPLLATAGVALNMASCPSVAAAVTLGSLFAHTLAQALQMGAVYEVYRNCAGYYADVEKSIERVLRLPVHQRQDAGIFLHKTSMLLGRTPGVTPIAGISDKKAGTLF
ncbi:hypothetical protein MPTK1_5g01100 [Marchantia polymorpha subsp. ruderalis]|nr:hypothetical protein MARPO_0197s0004 [Marchantia polymorpha]BBN10110.1 hypothetical protein Mp_5g01100 [Marchantia polymorpha subsp. ruderalis]|eukprot:PTQ27452.1 hypothetical protein MARPO_0197s0004 [Marchantia polymorpha]